MLVNASGSSETFFFDSSSSVCVWHSAQCSGLGSWKMDTLDPLSVLAVVVVRLLSMLSTAVVVNCCFLKVSGHITLFSVFGYNCFPSWVDICNSLSYEILKPFSCDMLINYLFLVLVNTDMPAYTAKYDSWAIEHLPLCSFLEFGKAVIQQKLWNDKVGLWCAMLNLRLDICTIFNRAYKLKKWWWDSLFNASFMKSVAEILSVLKHVSSNQGSSLGQIYNFTISACLFKDCAHIFLKGQGNILKLPWRWACNWAMWKTTGFFSWVA